MDIKNFILSYYKDSTDGFYIHKVEKTVEARKPHTHEYFQIYYIIKGKLEHFVENESSIMTHGDMFIIPPGVKHYISPDDECVFYAFSFMPDFFGDISISNKIAANFLRDFQIDKYLSVRPKFSLAPDEIILVESTLEHMFKEFKKKSFGFTEIIRAYALLLITLIARSYFEREAEHINAYFENNKEYVLYCVRYIEENYEDNISLEEMCRRSAMSRSSFCGLFFEITGYSFNTYLNMCRIKKACRYIKEGYKITAIYGLCGYADFSTFYRNFKKIIGVSPKQYKSQYIHKSFC